MAKNTEKNDPIRQTADALDKWVARREPKPIEGIGHISFYGSLLQALGNLQSLVEIWLRDFRPNQLDLIHNDFDELYEKAKNVGRLRGEEESSGEISVMIAKAAARELAEKLRLIADTGESYQKQTRITEQNTAPAISIQNSNVILGNVHQPENLQVGDNANINKHEKTEGNNKGIVWNLLKWFIGIIAAAVATDILGDFGWIHSIKAFIYSILWPK